MYFSRHIVANSTDAGELSYVLLFVKYPTRGLQYTKG